MNKQELIDHLKRESEASANAFIDSNNLVFQGEARAYQNAAFLCENLGEPQKVKVPAFVIELMNEYRMKHPDITFYGFVKQCSVEGFGNNQSPEGEVAAWLTRQEEHESILMKVWIDGNCCEVEEEPKYRVVLPSISSNSKRITVLRKNQRDGISISKVLPNTESDAEYLTEKEIKSVDVRYWPFAVPVEKV